MQTEKSTPVLPSPAPILARARRACAACIEHYSWLLLLLAVVPGFLLAQPDMAVTLYRALVMLPVLVYCACKPAFLLECASQRGMPLFLAFSAYSLLSMLWNVDGAAPIELVWNVLSTVVLAMLVFLVVNQRPQRLPQIETVFLASGALCLALAYVADGFRFDIANLNVGYGVFTHHVYISWLAGSLAVLLLARSSRLSFAEAMFFCACFATILFSHGRGGLIVFTTAYLCLMFRQDRPLRDKRVVLCVVVVLCAVYVFSPFHLEKLVGKELNLRPEIWQHGYRRVTHDAAGLWFGAGLNASDCFYLHGFFVPHYHSLYGCQLYYGGIIGLALYLAMLATVLYRGFHRPALSPWWYVLVGMSTALLVDGDHFFRAPSPLFSCFLLPFFVTLFVNDNLPEKPSHA